MVEGPHVRGTGIYTRIYTQYMLLHLEFFIRFNAELLQSLIFLLMLLPMHKSEKQFKTRSKG